MVAQRLPKARSRVLARVRFVFVCITGVDTEAVDLNQVDLATWFHRALIDQSINQPACLLACVPCRNIYPILFMFLCLTVARPPSSCLFSRLLVLLLQLARSRVCPVVG
jgi:hypothetical protein